MTPDDLIDKYQFAPDPPALLGLSEIDWADLSHAHDEATDVPALLRAAVSDDPDDRDFAFELLSETICHQGTVYDATPHVVPFLYRMLETDETPDKQQVAILLATIADAMTGEEADMAAVRQAVGERLDLLYPYLRDPEWGVRQAVATAIGLYPGVCLLLLSNLEAALRKEPNQSVRLALTLAVGHSPEAAARLLPDLQAALRDEPDKSIQAAYREVIERLTQRHT